MAIKRKCFFKSYMLCNLYFVSLECKLLEEDILNFFMSVHPRLHNLLGSLHLGYYLLVISSSWSFLLALGIQGYQGSGHVTSSSSCLPGDRPLNELSHEVKMPF